MDIRNPFVGIYHDRNAGVLVRKPIPIEAIRNLQSECHAIDDDMRWLIALISDTGMRLAEGAGLLKEDLVGLDTDLDNGAHAWPPQPVHGFTPKNLKPDTL